MAETKTSQELRQVRAEAKYVRLSARKARLVPRLAQAIFHGRRIARRPQLFLVLVFRGFS